MTYVVIGLRHSGKCFKHYLLAQIFVFALQALSSPAPKSFLHAGTSSEVMHSGSSLLLSPFLQKGGIGVGGLGMPLCCFPRVFFSSRSTLAQREGWRSLWSLVRCMRAHFCLLGSFVVWGSRSCSLAADSCYLFCPGWFSLLISARPAR